MNINDIYEVVIDSVDSNGNGVCRIDNVVTFIFGALLNERVKIKIVYLNLGLLSYTFTLLLKFHNHIGI